MTPGEPVYENGSDWLLVHVCSSYILARRDEPIRDDSGCKWWERNTRPRQNKRKLHTDSDRDSALKNRSKHKTSSKISRVCFMSSNRFINAHEDRRKSCMLPHIHPLAFTHSCSLSFNNNSITWPNDKPSHRHLFSTRTVSKAWTTTSHLVTILLTSPDDFKENNVLRESTALSRILP